MTEAERNALVEAFAWLARDRAWNFWQKGGMVAGALDLDELRSVAYVGLVEASRSFDATKGARFYSHAWNRISGALIDALRSHTPGSRAEFRRGVRRSVLSLDGMIEFAETHGDPRASYESVEAWVDLGRALDKLTARERACLLGSAMCHKHAEIAARFGISESRVSQIIGSAREKTRERLAA